MPRSRASGPADGIIAGQVPAYGPASMHWLHMPQIVATAVNRAARF
ncbi:hypothetical protein STXM2123_4924 [Streptomyces sp. F-3]|nr:hypothetical protein STXM2123_4924 [Streptomyces sp. F-3]